MPVPRAYARPDSLLDTDALAQRLDDPTIRVVEVDVDTTLYAKGHVRNAVAWSWTTDLNDPVRRDVADRGQIEKLLSRSGIGPDTTIVLYGDHNNWFAAFAFWLLSYYGHDQVKLLDGGRRKWEAERRLLTDEVPRVEPTTYRVRAVRHDLRATRELILQIASTRSAPLVDVRSPDEYSGKVLAPPGLSETAQRGGHIPGALNVPWSKAVNEDGTFRSADELADLYAPIVGAPEAVTYCRIGERSSHTWFVAKHLLGVERVRNYDGSWTEYGNLIGAPIAVGAQP